MKPLLEYTKNNYDFTLVERRGDWAIFRGVKVGVTNLNWEVIRIQSHNGYSLRGLDFPPAEYPPSNALWGTDGFTCLSQDAATSRLNLMTQKEPSPQ